MTATLDKGASAGDPGGPDAPAPPAGKARCRRRAVDAYLYGNQIVVTLLALVVALVFGAVLIAITDAAHPLVARATSSSTRDTFSRAGTRSPPATRRCSAGRSSTPTRSTPTAASPVFWPALGHAGQRAPLILGGLAVGRRVPGRAVQHRRPGPDHHRRDLRRLRRLRLAPAGRHAPDRRDPRRHARRGASGAASSACSRPGPVRTRSSPRSCSTTSRLLLLGYLLTVNGFQAPKSDRGHHRATIDSNAHLPMLVRRPCTRG